MVSRPGPGCALSEALCPDCAFPCSQALGRRLRVPGATPPQPGGGLCPTPPGRRRNGKAHSAQHGSRRLHLFVRRRGRLRPSTGPRAAPAPSPRGLGDRHARAAAHGSPQPSAGPQGRRRLGSVSSGLRKCRGVRVMLSGYPEAGGSDTGDPEAGNSENLPTQPEDKDPVGCRHTPRL